MASRSAKKSSMKEPKGAEHEYDAQGAPEMHEAMDEEPGFKKGGKVKKHGKHHKGHKHGGKVEGEKEKMRADKKPRGMHHKRAAGGRTPYSSGHNPPEPSESKKTNSGHEGERPSSGA